MDQTENLNDQTPDNGAAPKAETERNASNTMASSSLSPIRGSNGYQQQIPIDPAQPLELSISNASGEVKLLASDQQNVWVVVRRVDGKAEDDEEVGVTIDVEGNRISVHPDWQIMSGLSGLARRIKSQLKEGFNPDDWNLGKIKLNPNLEYDIRVEVPRQLAEGSKIAVKTASGDVEVHGTRSDLSVATASGDVDLADLHGRVATHTASGTVKARSITGSLEINTASGSIHVEDGEAWTALRSMSGSVSVDRFIMKNARVTTVSGSVRAKIVVNNRADYAFETVSGSLALETALPGDGSGASLTFRSISGSSHVAGAWIPATGKRSWQLASGSDGPALRVKTVSGSLRVTGTTDEAVSLRNEPLPTDPDWADVEEPGARADHERGDASDLDVDINIEKAMGWVKEATRRIQEAAQTLNQGGQAESSTDSAQQATTAREQPQQATTESETEPISPAPPTPPTPPASTPPAPPTPPMTPATPPAEAAATPPMEPTDTVPLTTERAPEEAEAKRLRLLEAVERGEISIEEALAQMDGDEPEGAPRA